MVDGIKKKFACRIAQLKTRLVYSGNRRTGHDGDVKVIKSDDNNILRNTKIKAFSGTNDSGGKNV